MAVLLDLPDELLIDIISYFERPDRTERLALVNLCRNSKRLSLFAQSILYIYVEVPEPGWYHQPLRRFAQTILTYPYLASGLKELTLDGGEPRIGELPVYYDIAEYDRLSVVFSELFSAPVRYTTMISFAGLVIVLCARLPKIELLCLTLHFEDRQKLVRMVANLTGISRSFPPHMLGCLETLHICTSRSPRVIEIADFLPFVTLPRLQDLTLFSGYIDYRFVHILERLSSAFSLLETDLWMPSCAMSPHSLKIILQARRSLDTFYMRQYGSLSVAHSSPRELVRKLRKFNSETLRVFDVEFYTHFMEDVTSPTEQGRYPHFHDFQDLKIVAIELKRLDAFKDLPVSLEELYLKCESTDTTDRWMGLDGLLQWCPRVRMVDIGLILCSQAVEFTKDHGSRTIDVDEHRFRHIKTTSLGYRLIIHCQW
ncbi:hypothetical protein BDV95DRAFT_606123 [Massariosphaeria phaeospora]|uniref:F-box domain-containing protein n=1 Tax=Massariosphaeria phaeospora TaxID=100035 RepID=A0A7C8M979_9PLEO|nr:hypothetical protein BDV95DRAFT_606123 [Massariosphaeria phaeospora]